MPDLAERQRREGQLESEITAAFRIQRRQAEQAEFFGPIEWSEFSNTLNSSLRSHLARTFDTARDNFVDELDLALLLLLANERAPDGAITGLEWATQQARETTSGIVSASQQMLAQARAASREATAELADELEKLGDYRRRVQHIFSEERARNISITETTRAVSIGEHAARRLIEAVTDTTIVAIWITEVDAFGKWPEDPSGVCPICFPLHEKSEEVWLARFPFGPPAHPRCRCYKDYRIRT